MSKFIEIKPEEFNVNSFQLIGKDHMLITAEKDGKINTMTASRESPEVICRKSATKNLHSKPTEVPC